MRALTVGFLGGVPPMMGGGGLEIQMTQTAEALERFGHRVVRVECAAAQEGIDVLHGFHAEPALWQLLPHWTRGRCPFVVSPVLPVRPGGEVRRLFVSARLPGVMTTARMRRDVIRAADAVIALTRYESNLLKRVFDAPPERIHVISNGVRKASEPGLPPAEVPHEPYVLLLGNISRRKRQAEVLRMLAGRRRVVLAGALLDEGPEAQAFHDACRSADAVWLGSIRDPAVVRGLLGRADALVLLSFAEAQPLAVLEALSEATPAVVSDLPAHRELAAAYPGWIELANGPATVVSALDALERAHRPEPPRVPSWSSVAERLVEVYRSLV
jgi:glycosyltransferase involved in cell wall biosynthesis